MNVLKVVLSNREYEIITECVLFNIFEILNIVFLFKLDKIFYSDKFEFVVVSEFVFIGVEFSIREVWISMKVIVVVNLVELSLYKGIVRDELLVIV